MITEQQKNNIHKLSSDDCLIVMHECAERLGLVSVSRYNSILGIPKRTIYQQLKDNKLKFFEISGVKFPIINEK